MNFLRFTSVFSAFLSVAQTLPTSGHIAESPHRQFLGFSPTAGVEAFLGIPFAEPPVDKLRFQPPQPLSPPTEQHGLFDATEFGPVCYQFHLNTPMGPVNWAETTLQSEDCLNLNIWRPEGATKGDDLPVMIWVYGGGFTEGGGSVPIYNPQNLVKNNPNMIVVTFNYRLNLFGFPTVRNSSLTPNVGLLDQRAAIEWVRDNIDTFGGSSERITLFSESAGSVAVSAYTFAYKDDPIVQGIILESRVATGMGDADPLIWDLVAANVGCEDDNGTEGKEREIQCMIAKPAEELKHGISNITINQIAAPNGGSPIVDNKAVFTAEDYIAKAQRGDFAKLPVLLGSNNDEGDGIINFSPEFGLNRTLSDLATLDLCTCPVSQMASLLYDNHVPVWRYRYMPVFPVVTFYDFIKTYHIAEVPMVFGSYPYLQPKKQPQQVEIDASKLLQQAWVAFAHDPQSGLETNIGWPNYNPAEPTLVQLFANNMLDVEFVDPNLYDKACATAPMLSWEELGAPAPSGTPSSS